MYQVTCTAFYTSTVQRASVGLAFAIDGAQQPELSGMGYIRSLGSHNDSSVILTTIYQMTAGQTIAPLFGQLANGGTCNLQGANSIIAIQRVGDFTP